VPACSARSRAGYEPIQRTSAGGTSLALREEVDGLRNSKVQPRDCRGHRPLWSSPAEEWPGMADYELLKFLETYAAVAIQFQRLQARQVAP